RGWRMQAGRSLRHHQMATAPSRLSDTYPVMRFLLAALAALAATLAVTASANADCCSGSGPWTVKVMGYNINSLNKGLSYDDVTNDQRDAEAAQVIKDQAPDLVVIDEAIDDAAENMVSSLSGTYTALTPVVGLNCEVTADWPNPWSNPWSDMGN